MKKIYGISEIWNASQVAELSRVGILVEEGVLSRVELEPEKFAKVKDVVLMNQPLCFYAAIFDKFDLDNADWLAQLTLTAFGYPQPDGDFGFLDVVYDTSTACKQCGIISGKQKNPYRIRSDRTQLWGFSLGWIYDEIFVKREIYEDVFAPLGIGFWPVLIHRTGKESEAVVQLDLNECEWDFDMSDQPSQVCLTCGRIKYQVMATDFLPPLNGEPPNQIFRGKEFYGDAFQADQRIYVSRALRQELIARKVSKWFNYYPLKS